MGHFQNLIGLGCHFQGGGNYLGDDLNKFMKVARAEKQ